MVLMRPEAGKAGVLHDDLVVEAVDLIVVEARQAVENFVARAHLCKDVALVHIVPPKDRLKGRVLALLNRLLHFREDSAIHSVCAHDLSLQDAHLFGVKEAPQQEEAIRPICCLLPVQYVRADLCGQL
eukprot:CAMPEP_0119380156 /NCGR_PEP_ID=MMETSP1334-20130426/55746_1 /TAXON_ID=127549 /ORGANISM="Calcidiscus leptoporus, Strain RCC1130" /LENGTH=127 /DNA_ID=CAMNT_0007399887 /DNA_START=542 /DNA_END=925 /DNA_ORIENTATION=+